MRKWLAGVIYLFWVLAAWGGEPTALDRYVAKADPNYSFTHYHTQSTNFYKSYFLRMVSQQWRHPEEVDRTLWEHDVIITVPATPFTALNHTALVLIDGGSNGGTPPDETEDLMSSIAIAINSPVAIIRQIPNQPLNFADEVDNPRREDEILAYSMDKYLDTGDEEWPVHLAMTKAAVRGLDTIQSFLSGKSVRVDDFIVLGGSKRGWTTWLTAAVDPRIKAIAPVSIDMLNLGRQFVHQWEAYGFYSSAVEDYVAFDLPCRMQSVEGQKLLSIIDPYAYRDRYTMPKLIVNSAGDQFFLPDSSRFYFADLPEPKLLRYTPNTDHSQGDDPVELGVAALLWVDDINNGQESPKYTWTFEPDGSIRVQIIKNHPEHVYLWQATNPDARDFRLETIGEAWTKKSLSDSGGGVYIGKVDPPAQGFTAYMIELVYDERVLGGLIKANQAYTTDVRVTPDVLPFAGTSCPATTQGYLDNPQPGSYQSGIAVISGWVCAAQHVDVQFDGGQILRTGYGTQRLDTQGICGDGNNGFGLLYNMNKLGDGEHSLRLLADGYQVAAARFNVSTLGGEFLRGVSGDYLLQDFPGVGESVNVRWQEAQQNFAISDAHLIQPAPSPQDPPALVPLALATTQGYLENPQPDSFQSGIAVISGWACEADLLEIEFDGAIRLTAAYGTYRGDTGEICGDTDNGFGLLYNFNKLGDGVHSLRVLADNKELGRANFTLTTLGGDFLSGVSGSYPIQDFPFPGENIILEWQEAQQNFAIRR